MQHLAELADAALPVHEGPGTVGHRRHREDHVGGAGHLGLAHLEGHDEAGLLDGLTRERGVGEVGGVDATHDQATQLACGSSSHDGVAVATDCVGQVVDAPRGGEVDPGTRVGDRAAAREQCGQRTGLDGATVTGTARDPGDPGAGRHRELGDGGESTGNGSHPFADQDQRIAVEGDAGVMCQCLDRGRLVAGSGRDQGAGHLV